MVKVQIADLQLMPNSCFKQKKRFNYDLFEVLDSTVSRVLVSVKIIAIFCHFLTNKMLVELEYKLNKNSVDYIAIHVINFNCAIILKRCSN